MRPLLILMVVLVAISWAALADQSIAQNDQTIGGANADIDCDQILTADDAQAIFEAAATNDEPDPYGLDENENEVACDGDQANLLGTGRNLASCENFRDRRHAQALYDASGGNSQYQLNADNNGEVCRGNAPQPTRPAATRSPTTVAPTPTPRPPSSPPSTGPCDSTRVENGRAVICAGGDVSVVPFAGFDTFAASAAGGFGRAPDSTLGDAIRAGVQQAAPTGGLASFQQPAADAGTRVVESEQKANKRRSKSDKGASKRRQRTSASQDQRERERPGSEAEGR